MTITLAEAIRQLRDDLRQAVLDAEGQDIVFTPRAIEVELAITFDTEAKVGGGVKLLTFLDLSGEGKAAHSNQQKIKLTLDVADGNGNPINVNANKLPKNLR
jgi:hypothetical protein